MINWWGWLNLIYDSPIWIWIIILQQVLFVLLIFKLVSGNWMGKKSDSVKSHLSGNTEGLNKSVEDLSVKEEK